jgi:hypothetical protein
MAAGIGWEGFMRKLEINGVKERSGLRIMTGEKVVSILERVMSNFNPIFRRKVRLFAQALPVPRRSNQQNLAHILGGTCATNWQKISFDRVYQKI